MPNILFGGFVYNNAGTAVNGATVELFPRNTTTTAEASTTTNSSGYWSISEGTENRYDIRITNGSSVRFLKYDDEIQITSMEVANFRIRNPANTFEFDVVPAAITGDRQLTLPLLTGTATIVVTPGIEDLNMGGFDIDNAGFLILNSATAPGSGEVYAVNDNTGDLTLNALSGKTINLAIAGTDEMTLSATVLSPVSDAGLDLGTTSVGFNDLHLGSGGVVNFDGGDVTLTHSANTVTLAGGDLLLQDSVNLTLGTGGDVDLDYNGTDLVLNLTVAGSGDFVVNGGSIEMDDSEGITLGTGKDATIQYNGTNLIVLPRAVGAGDFLVQTSNSGETIIVAAENTNNASAAGHAVLEAKVGGTTSTGDPHIRWTIPSGTSWYAGPDNDVVDIFFLGSGSAVGAEAYLGLDPRVTGSNNLMNFLVSVPTNTLASGSGAFMTDYLFNGPTLNYTGTTQVTTLVSTARWQPRTIVGNTATLTVDKATTIQITAPTEGSNVTLTAASAIRILNASGTPTNQVGLFIESLTAGATDDYAIYMDGTPVIHGSLPAASAATNISLDSNNDFQQDTSSLRFKQNVVDYELGSDLLMALRPRSFDWRDGVGSVGSHFRHDHNFIAEEVWEIAPHLVNLDEDGLPFSLRQDMFAAPLVATAQNHEGRLAQLEAEVKALREAAR